MSEELPAELPGIDIRAGLGNMMNNEKLYLRMLRRFAESQQKFESQFAAAMAQEDDKTAERIAHTLKSTSGSIGATQVEALAGSLEAACVQAKSPDEINILAKETVEQLEVVLAGLSALKHPQMVQATSAPINPEVIEPLTQRLITALRDGDPVAVKLWKENNDAFKRGYPGHWVYLERALGGYDFETAIATLTEAMETRSSK